MANSEGPTIAWFRRDLRLADNPALHRAIKLGGPVIPLFIWSPEEEGAWAPGAASRYWLHQSLKSLDTSLREKGSRLVIRTGPVAKALTDLACETGASAVVWNRRYEPALLRQENALKEDLKAQSIAAESFNSALLVEPWDGRKKDDTPYLVYTPFANNIERIINLGPVTKAPGSLPAVSPQIKSVPLEKLKLEPTIPWATGIAETWETGEDAASNAIRAFNEKAIAGYDRSRDLPAEDHGVSRMSPHLHFGEISPGQVWRTVMDSAAANSAGAKTYLRELIWREFSHHLLYHFPDMPDRPLKRQFDNYPWEKNGGHLEAWQQGRTGYPIVDAGMRQLWHTGWMHNRVRMIVGSFLIKDLGLPWQSGEEWFWDTLVDADLAQNSMNWQWIAGCGADASPFFRIFNPTTQGRKFDPRGSYIRQWVPELAAVPDDYIHEPWEAPADVRRKAGIEEYPRPIVNHSAARDRALRKYQALR